MSTFRMGKQGCKTDEVGIRDNNVEDTLASEGLLTEPALDVVENFRMAWILVIEHVLQRKVRGSKTVAKVLSEDPAAVWSVSRSWTNVN